MIFVIVEIEMSSLYWLTTRLVSERYGIYRHLLRLLSQMPPYGNFNRVQVISHTYRPHVHKLEQFSLFPPARNINIYIKVQKDCKTETNIYIYRILDLN